MEKSFEEKINDYEEQLINNFDSTILKKYIQLVLKYKEEEYDASSIFNKLLINNPDNEFILNNYGKYLYYNNQKSMALKIFEKALNINSNNQFNLVWYARTLFDIGSRKESFKVFEKASIVNYSNEFVLKSHVKYLLLDSRDNEAYELLNKVLKLNPKDKSTLRNIGKILIKLERYNEALEKFNNLLEINPKDKSTLRNIGETLIKLERYNEALEKFNNLLEINPKDITAFKQKQFILLKLGNDRKLLLLESYEIGLLNNPNNIKILTAYGKLLAEIGNFEESFIQFEKLLEVESKEIESKAIIAFYSYGKALTLAGEYERAFIMFERALNLKPNDSLTYFAYAKALEANIQLDKAIEQMQKVKISSIPIHYKNVYFLYLGKLYFITKRYDLAEKAFKAIKSKSKSQKEALENIMQELISSEVKSKNILKNLGNFIEGFDKKDLDSISHIFSMEELFKFYADNELESKLQEDKELNSTIFHKLENHINLIRLTFDLIIKKNYSEESTKIAEELKERTTNIFKKIKAMREEQKKLNDEIGESLEEIEKKLNSIGEDIADKINNELSLLRIKIDLAQKKNLINEKTFSKLKKQITTSSAIADNLRIINKSTNLKIDDFQIRDIFENIEDKMTLQNATLSLDIRNEKNSFVGDKNRIKEIISELIENSIRHNSSKELKIDIVADDSKNPRINGMNHNGKYLYIKFNDNGIGVEEDKKEWIFLPTKTTSSEGSGLGLYIIRKTIKSMNGFIIENGTYEKGVQFEIFIPYK